MAWSLADTAASLRAEDELLAGVPDTEENDLHFYDLVRVATRDTERARRELKERVLNRRMAQTE